MRVAAGTVDFRSHHEPTFVGRRAHCICTQRCTIARPSSTGIKFAVRRKERGGATHTVIGARFVVVPQVAAKGALCAMFSRDVELLRRETSGPLFGGLAYLLGHASNERDAHTPRQRPHLGSSYRYDIGYSRQQRSKRVRRMATWSARSAVARHDTAPCRTVGTSNGGVAF